MGLAGPGSSCYHISAALQVNEANSAAMKIKEVSSLAKIRIADLGSRVVSLQFRSACLLRSSKSRDSAERELALSFFVLDPARHRQGMGCVVWCSPLLTSLETMRWWPRKIIEYQEGKDSNSPAWGVAGTTASAFHRSLLEEQRERELEAEKARLAADKARRNFQRNLVSLMNGLP